MLQAILSNLNFLAVLVAAVAAWLFGALWYTALSRPWMAAQGWRGKEDMPVRSGLAAAAPFIISFVAELIMAAMLYGIVQHIGEVTVRRALFSAFFIWLGFVATTTIVNNAYPARPLLLTVIDAGHWLGVLLVMGVVLGLFGA
jgi:hypothetical protein